MQLADAAHPYAHDARVAFVHSEHVAPRRLRQSRVPLQKSCGTIAARAASAWEGQRGCATRGRGASRRSRCVRNVLSGGKLRGRGRCGCGRRGNCLHQLQLPQLLEPRALENLVGLCVGEQAQVADAHDASQREGQGQRSARAVHADPESDEVVCQRLQLRDSGSGARRQTAPREGARKGSSSGGAKLTSEGRRLMYRTYCSYLSKMKPKACLLHSR